ncbi:hypothetical protein AFLA_000598 [Aspergillus flavus NRRL3357]|nr:hypothetical protein AFLA_000598 [Aspergillus flavus NRRL3357]
METSLSSGKPVNGAGALARVSSIHIEMFRDLNGPAFTRYLTNGTDSQNEHGITINHPNKMKTPLATEWAKHAMTGGVPDCCLRHILDARPGRGREFSN